MILLIDNYDSFTYNLYQQVVSLGGQVQVIKNDDLTPDQILDLNPEKIIISPGPKTPDDSGVCIPVIRLFHTSVPILGVCLGHQCLAAAFGQQVIPAQQLIFGKTTPVIQSTSYLMSGLPEKILAARYHALVVDKVPDEFRVTARDERQDIMAMEHSTLPLFGVQFHPESFLMPGTGDHIITRFLDI